MLFQFIPRQTFKLLGAWRWLLGWAVATAVTLGSLGRPTSTPMHVDEIYWIGSSYYCDLLFRRGDAAHPDWSLLPARENPPVAKYVIGLALATAGQPVTNPHVLGVFYAYFARQPGGWGNEVEQRKRAAVLARLDPEMRAAMAAGATVSLDKRILFAARWGMLVCAVGCSLVVLILAAQVVRPALALIASQLVLIHPLSFEAYNYAMADAPALFLSALAAAAVCQWAAGGADRLWRADLCWSVVTGALVGVACAAKMNALVVAGQAMLVGLGLTGVALRDRDPARAKRTCAGLAVMGAVALLVFVGVNPAIWRDPFGGLLAPYIEQKLSAELQAQFLGGFLATLPERIAAVAVLTGLGIVGLTLVTVVAVGCFFLPGWRRKAVACWWLFALFAVTGWLPFARGRYVLPLVVPAMLTIVIGLDYLWNWRTNRLTPRPIDGGPV